MKRSNIPAVLAGLCLLLQLDAGAQGFLKKLKDKIEKKVEEKVDSKVDKTIDKAITDKTGLPSSSNSSGSNNSTGSTGNTSYGKPVNKGGEGLKNTTPPDVLQQLTDADNAFGSSKFGDARFSIQQALLGVELQIGKQLLHSLPEKIGDIGRDTAQDRVVSNRWGWSNLTIQRVYLKGEKQLSITIGNNPVYMGMLDLVFGVMGTTQSNGETQNVKQIRIKGNKGIIKFDKDEGYTVLVQLGQSGLITWNGINYASEQEVTDAVSQFDIDSIKKMLGES